MNFSVDWFVNNIKLWQDKILPRLSKKIKILEIGSYEGRSTVWMMENIPESTITCVDTFKGGIEHSNTEDLIDRFKENIKGYEKRITIKQGLSSEEVKKLPLNYFDFVYIDGSHQAIDVLTDAVQSWGCLKKGGLMVFDDYAWDAFPQTEMNPRLAIDCFLASFVNYYELIHKDYQVVIKKL